MPWFTIEDVNKWSDSLLINKEKFEDEFIKAMQANLYKHELFFPLPEGILDNGNGEDFLVQAEAHEEDLLEELDN